MRSGLTLAALIAAGGLLAGCTQSLGETLGFVEKSPVEARKELMRERVRKNVQAIGAAIKANKLADGAKAAEALAAAARGIPAAFKERSLEGKTTALPVIWEKKADFDQKAKNLATAAAALAVVLKAGDKSGAEASLKTTQGTCGACHKMYRKPPPPKK